MDSIFKICKKGTCGIVITGLEKDNDEYLNETDEITVSTRNYAYSQTITINCITSITSSGEETIQAADIVEHVIDNIDESEMEVPIDGLYGVTHIILPTDKWLQYVLEREATALEAYNLIYYFDTVNNSFMKYIDSKSEIVTIEELLAINAPSPITVTEKTSTIIRSDKNTFYTCYINDCFYRICKSLLSTLPGRCKNKLPEISNIIQDRDILWMGLNVIRYLIELKQFYEAQRVLENITQCSNMCKTQTKNSIGGTGCGCNK